MKRRNYTSQTKQKEENAAKAMKPSLLNHLKLLTNLGRAFMSPLDTEFKPLKKPLSS